MKRMRRAFALILCMVLVLGSALPAYAEDVIRNDGEAWNTYLGRVYDARKAEFDALQAANADNNVPDEEVWTGNSVQPTEDADGDGLLDVYTAAQLRWALTNKKSLELMNDVDLGGRNNVNWTPVADPGNITIEGNGHTIYNMYVSASGKTGMIAQTGRGDTGLKIQNLRFRYCYVYSTGTYTGTVIGWMLCGSMSQVSVEDSVVRGTNHLGGIASGWNNDGDSTLNSFYVSMDQCHVRNVTTYGTSCVGSFVGPVSGYKITNSYSIDSYDISTATHSGGFVSCPGNCWVENCFTNVKLYCNSDGGVFYGIGHLANHFENCFAAGVVEGTSNVGGFFGRDEAATDTCINCYSTSMVGMQNTASNMGGFYGSGTTNTRITNCYSAGEVGTTQTKPGTSSASTLGGIGGTNPGSSCFSNCYYDKQTSGMGEYAIGTTMHSALNNITGYLTGQMIGDAMQEEFGTGGNWVYHDGMYPQLSVFANAGDSFGNATDQAIAKAYSAASVCTALLQPSNLDKTQEELAGFSTTDYDTVRNISVLFPLTNDALAGYISDSDFSISWDVREGYTCQIEGPMKGLPVITLDPNTYEVTNFAPGIGWTDVSVSTGIINTQNGEEIVGQRFLRLVPTTVISLASGSAGVDQCIYVKSDERLTDEDTRYDHRENVFFSLGSASDVDTGSIKTAPYPVDDATFGYDEESAAIGTVLDATVGGKAVVVVYKLNEETGEYEDQDIANNESLQQLLLEQRDAGEEDLGVYKLEYRWYTSGNLEGGYIVNSKTLTVRNVLDLTYDWNHPDHEEESLIYRDNYPYTIGETVTGAASAIPDSPETKGYTFMGWCTDPDADPDDFEAFTADTELEDDTVVYAIWKINTYDVSVVKNGRGAISGTGSYDYNTTAKVTWEPEEDWYVNYVMVDGVIRDDLLSVNEYVFEGVDQDHTVYVEFGQEPRSAESEYYQVTTSRTGGDDTCSVSNSVSARKGEDVTVTWSAGEGYKVTKVLVDGILTEASQNGEYTFSGISRNHEVEVVFEEEGKTGPVYVVGGYFNITTSKTGSGTISPSASVEEDQNYTVTWSAETDWHVAKVIIDGEECTDDTILDAGEVAFDPVDKDHTVEVIFEQDDAGSDPDPGPESKTYTVDTSLIGGPGTISPGGDFVVEEGDAADPESYDVSWEVGDERYQVKDIYVDGVSVKDDPSIGSEVTLKLDGSHKVLVVLEPKIYQIRTTVEGGGTISDGATVFWHDDYTVEYAPANGWKLKQIYVDGEAKIEESESGIAAFAAWAAGDPVEFELITEDHEVHAVFVKADEESGSDDAVKHTVTTSLSGGVGTITKGAVLEDGSDYTVTWEPAEGYEVDSVVVKVNGIAREGMVTDGQVVLTDLSDDVDVIVTLRPVNAVDIPGTTPDDTGTHDIYTSIEKGAGTITASLLGVAEGSSQTVYWTFGEDSAIRTIYVDGVVRDDLLTAGQYTFDDITEDHTVDIYIKEDPNGTGGVVDKESYRINTAVSGQGQISDSTAASKGDTVTISWEPADGYEVSRVFIDGAEKSDLADADGITFANIGADHNVYVEFTRIGAGGDTPSGLPQYNITTAIQGNGTISSSSVVEEGESKTIRWSPKDGSVVAAVIIDGVSRDDLLTAGEYSFSDITEDHTVEILFRDGPADEGKGNGSSEEYVYIKTATTGQGSISSSKTLKKGSSYVVSWEAAEGWKVAGILIDGLNVESLTEAGQVAFQAISANHTVQVVFVPADGSEPGTAYKIETDIVGGEGTITASGEALAGGNYTVTWQAAQGYKVASVIVDGVERNDLLAAGAVTFTSVDANHTVRVILEKESAGDSGVGGTKAGGRNATGDAAPVMAYAVLAVFACGAILVLSGKKVRKRRK